VTRCIVPRLDAALALLAEYGVTPSAISLTETDYLALARAHTRRWRETTGSSATAWPLSYADVPLQRGRSLRRSIVYGGAISLAVPRQVAAV
jgi:hypothetical protein